MSRLTLRIRITLLTGILVLAIAIVITTFSVYNATDKIELLNKEYAQAMEIYYPSKATNLEATMTASVVPLDQDIQLVAATISQNAKKSFGLWSYIFLAGICIMGMAAAYWVSGRALRPVSELAFEVAGISANNLGRRISVKGSKDEIGRLTQNFNSMLERLEQSFASQKRFSANAAHELKTPLATMLSQIQVLRLDREPSKEDVAEALPVVEESIKRLGKVVDDLLLMTNDKDCNLNDEINLYKAIENIIEELKPLWVEKEVTIARNIDSIKLYGQETLVYRMLFNLIENSIKYNRQRGQVWVSVEDDSLGKCIVIKDTGIGVPLEEIGSMWEPFYRISEKKMKCAGGAGLGLALVKSIVEKHGWEISVSTKLDVGTEFRISIC